mgnify:FL=1
MKQKSLQLVREMRGIPFFLLREYLEELGGKAVSENLVEGPGWSVRLTRMEPFRLGSISVGQTRLEIDIEEDQADDFMKRFSLKTLRAGG